MAGTLFGIGVGPGDPDLITLKALKRLAAVPVIAYPAPLEGDSLARDIVAGHLPGGQTEIAMRMPMVAARFPAQEVYDRAADEIGGHLNAGRDVAILCEGDPFVYGSFMYLFGRLAQSYRTEVIPGVSSLTACAASLGAPLAARNDILTVIPAPLPAEVIRSRLESSDSAAILKLSRHFAKVRDILHDLGLAAQSRYIERATLAAERTETLDEVDPGSVPYFSMILTHRRGVAWRLDGGEAST